MCMCCAAAAAHGPGRCGCDSTAEEKDKGGEQGIYKRIYCLARVAISEEMCCFTSRKMIWDTRISISVGYTRPHNGLCGCDSGAGRLSLSVESPFVGRCGRRERC